ncbi:MAG: PKD domain-containing protein [Bacteroidota bacterium]
MKNLILISLLVLSFVSCKKEIKPDPIADFSFYVYLNEPGKVDFTNKSTNATKYSWQFGDGINGSTETSPSHIYSQNGGYYVILSAISDDGVRSTTSTQTVTITNIH